MVKTCAKCGEWKDLSEFNQNRCTKDGYEARCKVCRRAWYRETYPKWAVRAREKARRWLANNYVPTERRCRVCGSPKPHPGRCAPCRKRSAAQWARDNAAQITARVARRHAAKANATPKWLTPLDQAAIDLTYEIARWTTLVTGVPHEVDHIFPLKGKTVCGLHVPGNLRIITAQENASKGNRLLSLL